MNLNYSVSKKQSPIPSGLSLRSGNLQKKSEPGMQQPVSGSSSSKQSTELKRATGKTPNAEQILQHLENVADYDPELGGFIVHNQPARARSDKVGKSLGNLQASGYLNIPIAGITWRQSHLVWLWHHGSFPEFQIDHINGKRDDDRIENLRDVSGKLNCRNRKSQSNSKTGITGINFDSEYNKYRVRARADLNGKPVHVGRFNTLPEAARALLAYHKTHPDLDYTDRHLQSLYDYLDNE